MPLLGGWQADPLWAPVYDWIVEHPTVGGLLWQAGMGASLARLHRTAEVVADLPAGAAVLDVPVGGGLALRSLRPDQGVRYVACDISPAMLERTRRRADELGVGDQVETLEADVGALPFDDDEFDLVLSLTGLHCFPDPGQALREMVRVLRPGGQLVGSTLLEDGGLRTWGVRQTGRQAGLLGPGIRTTQLKAVLRALGMSVTVERDGPFAYFTAGTWSRGD